MYLLQQNTLRSFSVNFDKRHWNKSLVLSHDYLIQAGINNSFQSVNKKIMDTRIQVKRIQFSCCFTGYRLKVFSTDTLTNRTVTLIERQRQHMVMCKLVKQSHELLVKGSKKNSFARLFVIHIIFSLFLSSWGSTALNIPKNDTPISNSAFYRRTKLKMIISSYTISHVRYRNVNPTKAFTL